MKNGTLIFKKGYDIFCQNQVSVCFYQTKDTNLYFTTKWAYTNQLRAQRSVSSMGSLYLYHFNSVVLTGTIHSAVVSD